MTDFGRSFINIYTWFIEFKRARINLTDDLREGHPSTVTTEDNISAALLKIEADKRVMKAGLTVTIPEPKDSLLSGCFLMRSCQLKQTRSKCRQKMVAAFFEMTDYYATIV
ncbi:hypothetical protein EVAR_42980_1 [Eumeta japonica]|uniref:Uncharacterized protein n=1 Tax=Eumeta variegata TaxID=151549 RepID=A0A4C1WB27_EUMVA|nr:hypothetical protein EVAR_42980_1 [Eumeta japonica]